MTNKSRVLFILRVSSRYLLSKRSGNSRLINVISFIGLVLGLTLLIVVLAVLNGNRNEIDDYIFGVYPHAIARVNSDQVQLLDELQSLPDVTSIEPFVDLYGSLSVRGRAPTPESGIAVYGFSSDSSNRTFRQMYRVLKEPRDLPLAGLDYFEASARGLSRGDTLSLTVPLVNSRGVQSKTVAFRYAGPLRFSNDSRGRYPKIMYVQISDLIAHGIVTNDQIHYRITLDEPKQADSILGKYPEIVTWTERFGSLYQALAMEKTILFVLLLFVIGLVIMSVISGQAMFVNKKSSDIAILQTLGAELRWVSIVFMCQGAIIVIGGIVVGTILGCVVAHYAHDIMHFIQRFQEDERNIPDISAYLASANVAVQDLIWTILAVLLVGFVAILRPLSLVFKKAPVESLNRMI